MSVTFSAFSTITGNSEVLATGTARRVRTILSNTRINFTTNTSNLLSNARISLQAYSSILSSAKIAVNNVALKLYKESDLLTEVGTLSNPIIFDSAIAGEITLHPDNPFLLYNDKDGFLNSTDAKNITVVVLEFGIIDEPVGVSNGTATQSFSVAYQPVIQGDPKNLVKVRVGATVWSEVGTFVGTANTDEIFVVNYDTGSITFGNGVNGAIPANLEQIFVSYSPNTTRFGKEARSEGWFSIQSYDVDSHDRTVLLVPSQVPDLGHVQLFHVPLKATSGIQGVWLKLDPSRLATNYFTGGSYNDTTGLVTLGTPLPFGTTQVLVDYKYIIKADAEVDYTSLSRSISHTFVNSIPSGNAKKINFAVTLPPATSPTNGIRVKFRLRLTYTEY